jgi:hypothetical protein
MLSVQLYRHSENISVEKEDTRMFTVQSKKANIHEGPEQKSSGRRYFRSRNFNDSN